MTNEEKAMNLSGICSNCDITRNISWCQKRDVYDGALEMAKWKDEQHKSEIDDLLKRLHEAEERERIARKIINEKNNELKELVK